MSPTVQVVTAFLTKTVESSCWGRKIIPTNSAAILVCTMSYQTERKTHIPCIYQLATVAVYPIIAIVETKSDGERLLKV